MLVLRKGKPGFPLPPVSFATAAAWVDRTSWHSALASLMASAKTTVRMASRFPP